jgi:hypothetical protein
VPKLVVSDATLKCSEGLAPSTLTILPQSGTAADEIPAGTVMDFIPMSNIAPFGMCKALANPRVAAATAAAMGTLTPQPCVPVVSAPRSQGANMVTLRGLPALTGSSTCQCAWTGIIEITDPKSPIDVD